MSIVRDRFFSHADTSSAPDGAGAEDGAAEEDGAAGVSPASFAPPPPASFAAAHPTTTPPTAVPMTRPCWLPMKLAPRNDDNAVAEAHCVRDEQSISQ